MTCAITFTFACHIYSKMSLSTFKSSFIWQTQDEKTVDIHFRLIPTLIRFIRKINQIHLLGSTRVFHLGFFSSSPPTISLSLSLSPPPLSFSLGRITASKSHWKLIIMLERCGILLGKVTWHSEKSSELIIRSPRFKARFSSCLAIWIWDSSSTSKALLTFNQQCDLGQRQLDLLSFLTTLFLFQHFL